MNINNFNINEKLVIICTVIIVVCTILIIIALKVDKKRKKKYIDCIKAINDKKDMSISEVMNSKKGAYDEAIVTELINLYLSFLDKYYNYYNSVSLEDVLCMELNEMYINKINNLKRKNMLEVKKNIQLLESKIVNMDDFNATIRIKISCIDYIVQNDNIIRGNDYSKNEEIFLVVYKKIDDKWLIYSMDKVYEKKIDA